MDVSLAKSLRKQHLGGVAEHVRTMMAEDLFGPRVHAHDRSVGIENEHGVRRDVEEVLELVAEIEPRGTAGGSHRSGRGRVRWKRESHRRPAPWHGVDPKLSTVSVDDRPAQREADACAVRLARGLEALEHREHLASAG